GYVYVPPELLEPALGVLEARVVARVEARHGVHRALDGVHDVGDPDRGGVPGEPAAATCAPEALDQPRLVQGAQLLFEEPKGDVLTVGDGTGRDEGGFVLFAPAGQLDHG